MNTFILAAVVVFCSTFAVNADPAWSGLRGTFLVFAPLPRTIREPIFASERWLPINGTANDCTNGGRWNGVQYARNGTASTGVALLFDVNGVIAGIQMLVPHSSVLGPNNTLNYGAVPIYNNATYNNEDYLVLTSYFVNPATICSTGRSDDELERNGTGTGLWIQNGTSPASLLQVPQTRPEGQEAVRTGWTENNCFQAMGYHNFYRVNEYTPTNCTQMDPVFGLYNDDRELQGFGFITVGTEINPRFENPPGAAIQLILGETPTCVLEVEAKIGITSHHVYFGSDPHLIACPSANSTAVGG